MRRTLALLILSAATLSAQETINQASLSGTVTDPTGARIAHATITALDTQTNIPHNVIADAQGRFRFAYLPVGPYSITTTNPGFAPATNRLTLTMGGAFDLPITLALPTANAVDTVYADAIPIETTRTQLSTTVLPTEVQSLPYLGRNFLDLALLLPGVSATNTASTQLFAETSAVPGQGLSVNSQRNFSNSYILDGLSANDDAAGLVQTSFSLEAIAEMQVVTSGGQAEFGRALGGYLSFVTRAGTAHLHGSAFGFLRNQRLNAANAFAGQKVPLTQAQYGASLGGPILPARTFFFATAEQRHLNQSGVLAITPANVAAIDTRLNAVGYPGQVLSTGTLYPNPVKSSNFLTRLDHHASDRDDLTLRYSLYHVSAVNSRGAGGLTAPSAAAALDDLDQTIAASNVFTLTPRTVNETRAQFTRSNLSAPVNDPLGPAVSISGVASFGTLSGSPTGRFNRLYEVVDNLSHQAGPHALRAGADLLFNDLTITFPMSSRGAYAFSSLANFQKGTYSTFTQSFGNPVVPQTNPNLGIYVQDSWQATKSLTLNLGLRYDLDYLKAVATDTNNLSPRIGLAWTPYPNSRTVLRASYGLFYDRIPLRALSNALESNGNTTVLGPQTFTTLALSFGQSGAPVFPQINATVPTSPTTRISLSTLDPHLPNPYSQQASVELEQQLSQTATLALSYQHTRGTHLIASVNLNTPTCTSTVDPVNLCRPNPAYANNKQYTAAGDSYYDGLAVSLVQRPTKWASARLSYTWSKAIDDVGEFFFSAPVNNYFVGEDRGRSDDDQRHRLTANATLHTPSHLPSSQNLLSFRSKAEESASAFIHHLASNIQLSSILQYTSRLPYNLVTGSQSIQQTAQRPCLPGIAICTSAQPGTMIPRNAGTGFDFYTLNTRLSKTIYLGDQLHLEALAESFNTLNHRNNLIPNTTNPIPTPTATADPRQVQLALRLTF